MKRALSGGLGLWLLAAGARADDQTTVEEPTGIWAWLRSENEDINDGNAQLAAGDAKGALNAYDKAAQRLPSDRGVHLNRGLALLASGELAPAREALQQATQPPAKKSVRAAAYYNLGNSFYKEGDTLAGEQNHEEAQKRFREAVDAFKQSLRMSPGDANAAWNLELASRRLTEEQEKQKQQEEENKQDQDQDKQDQDQDKQDQDQDKQNQDQDKQNQDQDKQDQDKQDQDKQDQDKQDQDKQNQDQDKQDQDKQDQDKQDQDKQDQDKQDQDKQDPQAQQPPPQPSDVQRALDALQDGEENLERHRARQRAARERRQPEKDW